MGIAKSTNKIQSKKRTWSNWSL